MLPRIGLLYKFTSCILWICRQLICILFSVRTPRTFLWGSRTITQLRDTVAFLRSRVIRVSGFPVRERYYNIAQRTMYKSMHRVWLMIAIYTNRREYLKRLLMTITTLNWLISVRWGAQSDVGGFCSSLKRKGLRVTPPPPSNRLGYFTECYSQKKLGVN